MMDERYTDALARFQTEERRAAEEEFARLFAEEPEARLFFINENEAFTDGRIIVVNPAADGIFADKRALQGTVSFLGLPADIFMEPEEALHAVTRAQTIHECLHLLYTDFPMHHLADPLCDTKNKKLVMGLISNIIEDAYIEAAGASLYDNIEMYLKFGRVSRLFASHPGRGTAYRALSADPVKKPKAKGARSSAARMAAYLDYMAGLLLYPMVRMDEPEADIAVYVRETRNDFLEGSLAPSPDRRYAFSQRIFKRILPLIPPDTEKLSEKHFEELIGGTKTMNGSGQSLGGRPRKGRSAEVQTRLFTTRLGEERDMAGGEAAERREAFSEEVRREASEMKKSKTDPQGGIILRRGSDYDAAAVHRDIHIREFHPETARRLSRAYRDVCRTYRAAIRKYNGRFADILRAETTVREEKFRIGSGITSSRLGDPKRRWWHRDIPGEDVPDLAVLLLIDGSGSMYGPRCRAAMESAVILHEVLAAQDITHAVALHRACFEEPVMEAHILLPFGARGDEKYNLMQIDAGGDNRDGLALFWAERYIKKHTENDKRLILVLSDGWPEHEYDAYHPPVSDKDTANAAAKIIKRGTDIIAVALDKEGETETYDALSEIYPNLVSCSDLSRLTGQILGVLARILRRGCRG